MHRFAREPIDVRHLVEAAGSSRSLRDDSGSTEDSRSIEAISGGSRPAFAALLDRTSGAVRAAPAGRVRHPARAAEVFAATYVEVWWLAGCHVAPTIDVLGWITCILRRRIADAQLTPECGATGPATLNGDLRPSYLELELVALLGRPVDHLTRD